MLLYLHRYAAHHHDDFIGTGGYVLVEPAEEVGEMALDGIGTYSAEAYLVGYEDKGGILAGEAVELVAEHLEGGVGVAGVEEVVGGPQGEAVDEDGAPLDIYLAQLAFLYGHYRGARNRAGQAVSWTDGGKPTRKFSHYPRPTHSVQILIALLTTAIMLPLKIPATINTTATARITRRTTF